MVEQKIKKECEEKWKSLTLSDNFIFQKFMLNPENCRKVLSEILGMEVVNVEYPDYEKTIDMNLDSKSIRLDVYVKGDGNVYNIEMQCSEREHIPKRSRYYQSMIDMDLLEKGAHYSELNRSFVIFICTFDYFGLDRYKYTFVNECDEVKGLEYNDETVKIVVNTKGHVGEVSRDFKDFINAVNGEFDSTEFSAKIRTEVENIKSNSRWRREYMTLYLHEQDIMREGIETGRAEGLEEGRAEGLEAGRIEGLETGRMEGLNEATELAVRNMLKKLSVEDIVELGYDKELVMRIAEEE